MKMNLEECPHIPTGYTVINKKIDVKIKKLSDNAVVPKQATTGSAGFDLHVDLGTSTSVIIQPNERVKLGTGLAFALPENYVMLIAPRSSAGIKKGLMLQNTIGVLDSDYRGECFLFVTNVINTPIEIIQGERIAQALILPYPITNIIEVDELDETDRGDGGFGSTGRV